MNFTRSVTNAANWIAASPTPGDPLVPEYVDSDGDGMPDGWEIFYHFDPEQDDASADYDHDGMSNWEEFLAGTDPTNPNDGLRLMPVFSNSPVGAPQVQLQFSAISNKTYTILYRNAAAGDRWTNLVHISALPTNRIVTVTNTLPAGLSSRFYLLTTPRLP